MREMGADELEINEIQEQLNGILDNNPPRIIEKNHAGATIGNGDIRSKPKPSVELEDDDREGWESQVTPLIRLEASAEEIDHHASTNEGPKENEQAVEWTKKIWVLEEIPTSLKEEEAEECMTVEVMGQITEKPYQGLDDHNPMDHILKFEEIIRKTGCDENSQEYLRLKFFPLSLEGQAARWDAKFWEEHSVSWEFYKCRFLKNFYIDSIWSQEQDEPERTRKQNREFSPDLPQQSLTAEETTEDDIGYSRPYKAKMSDAPEKAESVVRSNAQEILSKGYMETRHNTSPMQPAEESRHTTDSGQRLLRTEGDHLEPLPILPDPPDAEISVVEKLQRCKPPTSQEVTSKPIQETVEERKEHPADPADPQPPQKKRKRRQKKKEWVQKRPGIKSPKDKSGHWRHKPPPDPRDEFLSFIEEYIEDPFLDHLLEDMRSWDKPYTHPYLST